MHMSILGTITNNFVCRSQKILGDNLVGIYLHGSAAMGCFHEKKSDIDLLVVVNTVVPDEIKREYMDMVVELNACATKKGIEFSIVRKSVCKPFIYPTPFELHFSNAHLQWYKTNALEYVEKMNGVDKDLAAHFMIIYHRGERLLGEEIGDVFEEPGREFYFDSIWSDIEDAEEEISENPIYIILNLCRVLAYKRKGLILSKQEGGEWGINHVPEKYRGLILQALDGYAMDMPIAWDQGLAHDYAVYMIEQIKN